MGAAALLDPAARRLVLVRAARVDPAHLRADDRRAVGGARARRSRAPGTPRASPTSRSASATSCTCRGRTSSTCGPPRCSTTSATSASTTPRSAGRPIEPSEVTDKGAEILRQTEYLRPAGDLLARTPRRSGVRSCASRALRRAHRGRHVVQRRGDRSAVPGPGYVYDPRCSTRSSGCASTRRAGPRPGLRSSRSAALGVGSGSRVRSISASSVSGPTGWRARRDGAVDGSPGTSGRRGRPRSPGRRRRSTRSPAIRWRCSRRAGRCRRPSGRCFTVVSGFSPSGTRYGIPWFRAITNALIAIPIGDHTHAGEQEVREPEADDQDVGGEQDREADVVVAGAGEVDDLEQDLQTEPGEQQYTAG